MRGSPFFDGVVQSEALLNGQPGRVPIFYFDGTAISAGFPARLAALNCLAEVRALLGSLDAVSRVLRLTGYVASAPGFGEQPSVMNGASELMEQVFGDAGRHARSAIGVAELPSGAPVEVELIVEAAEGS